MAQIGKTSPFNPKEEEWTQYIERLQHFFAANGHTEAAKKKSILLTAIGPTAYKILSSLTSPAKPGDMKTHCSPVPSEIVERFRFHTRSRLKDEDFVAALRAIAVHCNFGDSLDTMLRDRIVCGISDEHTQRRLLAESTLTLKSAMTIAQSLERASENAETLKQSSAATPGNAAIPGTPFQGSGEVHNVSSQARGTLECKVPRSHVSVVTKPIICPVNADLKLPSPTIVAKRDISGQHVMRTRNKRSPRLMLGTCWEMLVTVIVMGISTPPSPSFWDISALQCHIDCVRSRAVHGN